MNTFEKKLTAQILELVDGDLAAFTPSLRVVAYEKGRLRGEIQMGREWDFYDLASLTKVIFGVTQTMLLVSDRKLKLTDSVSKYLDWWPHKKVSLKGILSHSAGLPWWAPFYKQLNLKKSEVERREQLRKILAKTELQQTGKAVYSDLDFILLGYLLEELRGQPLIDIFAGWNERAGLKTLHFSEHNKPVYARARYAPTENCKWRGKVMQGEVGDENTWSFGGVSTHAGLFGRIEDVAAWGLELRKAYYGSNKTFFGKSSVVRAFTKRAIPKSVGDWASGFVVPTKFKDPTKQSSTSGRYFSAISFGHTGFTGTSFWFDPVADVMVVALANRVHPTRENARYVGLRPKIHDAVRELL